MSDRKYFVVKNRNKRALSSKFEYRGWKLESETKHNVSDRKKIFHKKDIAEIRNSVANNQDASPAKEVTGREHKMMKNVNRGIGGRFAKTSEKGRTKSCRKRCRGNRGKKVTDIETDDETSVNSGNSEKRAEGEVLSLQNGHNSTE